MAIMTILKNLLKVIGQFIAIILVGSGLLLGASIPVLVIAGFFV